MNEVVKKVREFVLEKCEQHKTNPKNVVELGALLHDISMPSEYGERSEHHIFSAEMAETLLKELNYPQDKISMVRKCVINHPGRNAHLRDTMGGKLHIRRRYTCSF